MDIINPLAEAYISKFSAVEDEKLFQIHQQVLLQHPQQHLQSSWVQGQFLTFISQLAKPKYILEIGTFTGFSAICLAKGLQTNGELHTIELRFYLLFLPPKPDREIAHYQLSLNHHH